MLPYHNTISIENFNFIEIQKRWFLKLTLVICAGKYLHEMWQQPQQQQQQYNPPLIVAKIFVEAVCCKSAKQ